jgi:hypothetical protein
VPKSVRIYWVDWVEMTEYQKQYIRSLYGPYVQIVGGPRARVD